MRLLHLFPVTSRRGWLLPALGLALFLLLAGLLPAGVAGGGPDAGQDHAPAPVGPAQATPGPEGERDRYVRGDSNIQFQWNMLIDALALAVARFWQCCGLLVILALPVFFAALWVKSRNRRRF